MYAVNGCKVFDADGNYIEHYQPNLETNGQTPKEAIKTTLDHLVANDGVQNQLN